MSKVDVTEDTIQPWERQPNESDKAFAAFVAYRDMGEERSIRRLSQSLNKSVGHLGKWSSEKGWQERVAAWERYQDRSRWAENIQQRRQMNARHGDLATALMTKAVQRIAGVKDASGAVIVKALDPNDLDAKDVVRLAALAVDVERKAREPVPLPGVLTEQFEHALAEAALNGNVAALETALFNLRPDRWKDKHNAATAFASANAAADASASGPLPTPALDRLSATLDSYVERLADAGRQELPGSVPGFVDTTATSDEGVAAGGKG